MTDKIDWDAVKAERSQEIDMTLSGSIGEVWSKIRRCLMSTEIFEGNPIIYEGPTRSFLLPLQYEVLRNFIERYPKDAEEYLIHNAIDPNPAISAYCLSALSLMDSNSLGSLAEKLSDRKDTIESVDGCFGWEGSLAEFAANKAREIESDT